MSANTIMSEKWLFGSLLVACVNTGVQTMLEVQACLKRHPTGTLQGGRSITTTLQGRLSILTTLQGDLSILTTERRPMAQQTLRHSAVLLRQCMVATQTKCCCKSCKHAPGDLLGKRSSCVSCRLQNRVLGGNQLKG